MTNTTPILRPQMRRHSHSAFSLIELLVVIVIISAVMALAFPAISVMQRLMRGGASINTISVAVRTAAAYASKPQPDLSSASPPYSTLKSNGAAILFTPNGDIRILSTDRLAFDHTGAATTLQPARFGYSDVERDYINMPSNAGVVGILRVGADIRLIAPPFAVHFDRFGQATTGYTAGDELRMVYYDGNYDGKYNYLKDRSSIPNYDPDIWNSKLESSVWNKLTDKAGLRPQLPFECIETVIGILAFQVDDLKNGDLPPGFTSGEKSLKASLPGGYLDDITTAWLLDTDTKSGKLKNAQLLFFSRNSGSILKEYR